MTHLFELVENEQRWILTEGIINQLSFGWVFLGIQATEYTGAVAIDVPRLRQVLGQSPVQS